MNFTILEKKLKPQGTLHDFLAKIIHAPRVHSWL